MVNLISRAGVPPQSLSVLSRTRSASPLKEDFGRRPRGLFAFDVRFESRDFGLEQFDPLAQFLHRKQSQILPNLMADLLLRLIRLVDGRHGAPPPKILAATKAVVT